MVILGTAVLLTLLSIALVLGAARLAAFARPIGTVPREPDREQAGPLAPFDPPEAA